MKRGRALFLALSLLASCASAPVAVPVPVEALVLGIAQDGGLPHFGCGRPCCDAARREPLRRARVASLGLIDRRARKTFLIDATPDLPEQIESLNRAAARPVHALPDGILLTHAHVGHYTGLVHLGREVAATKGIPVWCTPSMAAFLRGNGPWSLLVSEGHVELREVSPGEWVALTPSLRATAIDVPHRREFSDCVAWRVEAAERTLLYLPDVDRWDEAGGGIEELLRGVDVALLDGTFFDPAEELPGRDVSKIPHPPIPDTLRRLRELPRRPAVIFTHLNHTNPALDPRSEARRSIEREGARVAREGEAIRL